jgi:hypothetical protein
MALSLGGTHVVRDTELLSFIETIFLDVNLREVRVIGVMYRTTNREPHTRAGSTSNYLVVGA